MWVERREAEHLLRRALAEAPVVVLTGPRQAGKSSLARRVIEPAPSNFFDLEDPRDAARLAEPTLALSRVSGTVVIDEAQIRPDLFPILRVLVDEDRRPGRFLVLGSASPDLIGLSAESLAGRVAFVELSGFSLADVGVEQLDSLWLRGGLPESFLAVDDAVTNRWRDDYITTFLQRDLAALGFGMPAATMRRFWTMLAHYHGQTWNGAELARSIDVSQSTVRRYVDALTDALVVRKLQPWHANVSKRQIKSPRVFLRDTGLLHRLLGISSMVDLERHPKLGASWEGLVIEHLATRPDVVDPSFWSTHTGAEVDLRLSLGTRTVGIEVKRTDSPSTTKSMHSAIETLELDHLYVVYGGQHHFPLSESITALPASDVLLASTVGAALEG
ncbi:MAG: putative AAA+ superfamily ATPase [Candidatus Poriferisodalaceae bacterium]|jgi:predicted AAA+ superfamily ATPase